MTGDAVPGGIGFPAPPDLCKIARANLVLLAIETELCPLVVPRVLAMVSARGLTAFTTNMRRDERIQQLEIEIAAPGDRVIALLLHDVLRLANVRKARCGFPPNETAQPIAAKL